MPTTVLLLALVKKVLATALFLGASDRIIVWAISAALTVVAFRYLQKTSR